MQHENSIAEQEAINLNLLSKQRLEEQAKPGDPRTGLAQLLLTSRPVIAFKPLSPTGHSPQAEQRATRKQVLNPLWRSARAAMADEAEAPKEKKGLKDIYSGPIDADLDEKEAAKELRRRKIIFDAVGDERMTRSAIGGSGPVLLALVLLPFPFIIKAAFEKNDRAMNDPDFFVPKEEGQQFVWGMGDE